MRRFANRHLQISLKTVFELKHRLIAHRRTDILRALIQCRTEIPLKRHSLILSSLTDQLKSNAAPTDLKRESVIIGIDAWKETAGNGRFFLCLDAVPAIAAVIDSSEDDMHADFARWLPSPDSHTRTLHLVTRSMQDTQTRHVDVTSVKLSDWVERTDAPLTRTTDDLE